MKERMSISMTNETTEVAPASTDSSNANLSTPDGNWRGKLKMMELSSMLIS